MKNAAAEVEEAVAGGRDAAAHVSHMHSLPPKAEPHRALLRRLQR